jgi:UDPglucose--hexose-1-phosphate uridylyltransferase
MKLDQIQGPHRRLNCLTGEWVIVSAQRASRPWQGQIEKPPAAARKEYDPECYLCPGNLRAEGRRNPRYDSTFVFDNDFPALLPDQPAVKVAHRDLLVAESESGTCRVVCFSPRHDLSIPEMDQRAVTAVVNTWCDQEHQLSASPGIQYVQIFENRGAMMGASNPHPHCQIWSSSSIPNEIAKEENSQRSYFEKHSSCLLCDYIDAERGGERVVCSNEGFVALVPFWALWPFEILVVSTRHSSRIGDLTGEERELLADIMRQVTSGYDAVFDAPFPYSMGLHQQLSRSPEAPYWHFHAHYFPPLLRSATIRKFMAGYELLATPQRDVTPEWAADRLRRSRKLPL